MRSRRVFNVCLLCVAACLAVAPSHAQSADQSKPPMYIYVSEWAVPRAQWADMAKVDEQDRSLMAPEPRRP